jgi:hypothetical protein
MSGISPLLICTMICDRATAAFAALTHSRREFQHRGLESIGRIFFVCFDYCSNASRECLRFVKAHFAFPLRGLYIEVPLWFFAHIVSAAWISLPIGSFCLQKGHRLGSP